LAFGLYLHFFLHLFVRLGDIACVRFDFLAVCPALLRIEQVRQAVKVIKDKQI